MTSGYPVAVLAVPALMPARGGEPSLLSPGRLGSEPPYVINGEGGWQPETFSERDPIDVTEVALPLWWDDALVEEGWDRLRRAVRKAEPHPGRRNTPYIPTVDDARECVEHAIRLGLVVRVVLLDRIDGRLVERAS